MPKNQAALLKAPKETLLHKMEYAVLLKTCRCTEYEMLLKALLHKMDHAVLLKTPGDSVPPGRARDSLEHSQQNCNLPQSRLMLQNALLHKVDHAVLLKTPKEAWLHKMEYHAVLLKTPKEALLRKMEYAVLPKTCHCTEYEMLLKALLHKVDHAVLLKTLLCLPQACFSPSCCSRVQFLRIPRPSRKC